MENANNQNLRVPKQYDLSDTLHTCTDDPNNDVKTHSDWLYISTEEMENILKQW